MLRRTVATCALALVIGSVVAGLAGCGDDDAAPDEEERARLVDSLGFLADQGLTDDEVACTARAIEERLSGSDLDEVAAAVRRVDAGEVALSDLPADVSATLTESIASCAGAS